MVTKWYSSVNSISRVLLAGCLVLLAIHTLPITEVQAFAGTWNSIQSMNYGRYGHTATLLLSGPQSGKVLVAGGTLEVTIPSTGGISGLPQPSADDAALPASQTAELYDPANPTTAWALTASLNVPRVYHTATWIGDGKVLVAGGANALTNNSLNSAEIYDPVGGANSTPTWTLVGGNMAHAHTSATATRLDDGRVLIAGGYSGSVVSGNATDTVEIFNPVSQTWSSAPPMIHARTYHSATLIHPAGATTGRVLVVGGSTAAYNSTGTALSSAEIYDPVTNKWSEVQSLHQARSDHSETLLENGQVLIVGGYDPSLSEDEMYLDSAEIYNSDGNTWTEITPPFNARGNHTATLLENGPQNGKVLIVGGANSSSSVINAELFDPVTQTWLDAGDLLDINGGRVAHTATLLPNGQVLVAGGFLGIGTGVSADATAEVYSPMLSQTISVTQDAPGTAAYLSTFTVAATASSGLTVTYSSGSSAICTVDANGTFTMQKGTGVCLVQFDQAGDADYGPATRVTQMVNAQKINQTISITQDAPPSVAYHSTFQVAASADSSLGVVYSSSDPSVCTADPNGTFTMQKGTGTCTVQFSQPGDENYNPAPVKTSAVIAQKIGQTIVFNLSGERPYGIDFPISASTSSNLPITFSVSAESTCSVVASSQDPGNASITNATIHPTGTGACSIRAAQDGDGNYNAGSPVDQSVTIIKGTQVITVTKSAPKNAIFGTHFTVSATAPGGTVVYSSGSSSVCTNSGAEFTMLSGTGDCVVRYDQGGGTTYNPAPRISESVTAAKASQIITVNAHAPASSGYNSTFTVSASAPGGPVTYSSGSPTACSSSGANFTMNTGTGTCLVWFDRAADTNYEAAPRVIESVSAVKIDQTITIGTHAPSTAAYNSHFTVSATAPGGAVTYSNESSSVCANNGAEFNMLSGTGTCVVRYDQAGNVNYNASTRSESVGALKISQVIHVDSPAPNTAAYQSKFTVGASAPGGSVSYSSGSPTICSNSGAEFTMLTGTGVCRVQFDQSGNNNYTAAATVVQTVTAQKIDQVINISQDAPGTAVYHSTFTVAASSSSSLNVVYSSTTQDVCSVNSSGTFTMQKGSGVCVVHFDQPGNDNYNPAQGQTTSVTALKASQSITFALTQDTYTYGDADFTLSAVSTSGLTVSLNMGQEDPCTLTGNLVHIDHAGICTVTSSQAGDDNYLAAEPVQHQITILKAVTSIFLTDLTWIVDGQPKAVTAVPAVDCEVIVTYTGTGKTVYGPSTLAPTKIGTYSVTAVLDDRDYQGTANAILVIDPIRLFLPMIFRH